MTIANKAVKAGILAAAMSIAATFEGVRHYAYLDPVGIPTICFGHTAGVRMGDTATEAECQAMLNSDMTDALDTVYRELPDAPPMVAAAFGSFVYNLGDGNFRSSTLLRLAKSGDWVGACNQLPRWVYAKKMGVWIHPPGLITRREQERQLCLSGL